MTLWCVRVCVCVCVCACARVCARARSRAGKMIRLGRPGAEGIIYSSMLNNLSFLSLLIRAEKRKKFSRDRFLDMYLNSRVKAYPHRGAAVTPSLVSIVSPLILSFTHMRRSDRARSAARKVPLVNLGKNCYASL